MIKNYTSEVPSSRSVLHIEERLVSNGAKSIMKTYDGERLAGIAFIITTPKVGDLPFKLPARIDRVEKVLQGMYKRPRKGTAQKIKDQAERTAWRILADWVDIQMSMVELDQAELAEVFMPYIWDTKKNQTFFDKMKENDFLIEDKRGKS